MWVWAGYSLPAALANGREYSITLTNTPKQAVIRRPGKLLHR